MWWLRPLDQIDVARRDACRERRLDGAHGVAAIVDHGEDVALGIEGPEGERQSIGPHRSFTRRGMPGVDLR